MNTHENAEQIELLVLYPSTIKEVWEIMGTDAHVFDDNGGDPDGPSWYIQLDQVDIEISGRIEINNLGYVAWGYVINEYDGTAQDRYYMHQTFPNRWCGYSSRDVAYGIGE